MNEAHTTLQSAHDPADPLRSVTNPGRRRLAGMGLAAPVVLTLASRPAFGGQCLSNMMSGNLSDPDRGHCTKGWSPGAWKNLGGTINGIPTASAWAAAGCVYGNAQKVSGTNYYKCTGGTLLSAVPIMAPAKINNAPNTTLSEVLLNYEPSVQFHVIAAWLNAKLSAAAGSTFYYILTPQQVLDLASGVAPLPPGYNDLKSFLKSTWT